MIGARISIRAAPFSLARSIARTAPKVATAAVVGIEGLNPADRRLLGAIRDAAAGVDWHMHLVALHDRAEAGEQDRHFGDQAANDEIMPSAGRDGVGGWLVIEDRECGANERESRRRARRQARAPLSASRRQPARGLRASAGRKACRFGQSRPRDCTSRAGGLVWLWRTVSGWMSTNTICVDEGVIGAFFSLIGLVVTGTLR